MKTSITIISSFLVLITSCIKDKPEAIKKTTHIKTDNSSWNNVRTNSVIDYMRPKKTDC